MPGRRPGSATGYSSRASGRRRVSCRQARPSPRGVPVTPGARPRPPRRATAPTTTGPACTTPTTGRGGRPRRVGAARATPARADLPSSGGVRERWWTVEWGTTYPYPTPVKIQTSPTSEEDPVPLDVDWGSTPVGRGPPSDTEHTPVHLTPLRPQTHNSTPSLRHGTVDPPVPHGAKRCQEGPGHREDPHEQSGYLGHSSWGRSATRVLRDPQRRRRPENQFTPSYPSSGVRK